MIALPLLAAALVAAPSPAVPSPAVPSPAVPSPVVPSPAVPIASGLPAPPPAPTGPALPVASGPAAGSASAASPAAAPVGSPVASRRPGVMSARGSASDTYAYRFVPRQPKTLAAGTPQIFAVYLNSQRLRSLGPIEIKVATSPNVVKVTSSSNGRAGAVPHVAEGDFEANSKLPKLPIIAAGIRTTLDFTATSSTGQTVTVKVPVELQ